MLNKGLQSNLTGKSLRPGESPGKGLQALEKTGKSSLNQRKQLRAWSEKDDAQENDFPGATGPGSGARHFPSLEVERMRPLERKERKERFEMKTTKDYYREFPGLVRSSTPLYIKSAGTQEPLGKLEAALPDAGPETGHRKKPEIVDFEGRERPRLPSQPDIDKSDLLREKETRQL